MNLVQSLSECWGVEHGNGLAGQPRGGIGGDLRLAVAVEHLLRALRDVRAGRLVDRDPIRELVLHRVDQRLACFEHERGEIDEPDRLGRSLRPLADGDPAIGVADDHRRLADAFQRVADRRRVVGEAGFAFVARQVDRLYCDAGARQALGDPVVDPAAVPGARDKQNGLRVHGTSLVVTTRVTGRSARTEVP
jgi:hypothetical protein